MDNVVTLVHDEDRYVIVFDDDPESVREGLMQLGRWATDRDLNFSWYDAAVVSQRIRSLRDESPR